MNAPRTVIYDFGANNGDDVEYYLKKAELVVAIEANPFLCERMVARFQREIADGRLIIENAVLTTKADTERVNFYIHKNNHVLSQFPRPNIAVMNDYKEVLLPALPVETVFARHGSPHYVKIDLEHFDAEVLRALFELEVFPDYISAESHSIEVFCLLVALGRYKAFKLVDGATVQSRYGRHFIMTPFGREIHQFRTHSAGPFGNDIEGDWLSADIFFRVLSRVGLGWKDIHASRVDKPISKIAQPARPKP